MKTLLKNAKKVYNEYPRIFWTLVTAIFIDNIGSFLLFPFFALYLTKRFGVGMADVGVLFALFAVSGMIGSFIGGALTDRLGRRNMIIFSLLTSAFSSLAMGFVNTMEAFYLIAAISGLFTNTGGPAYNAIVGDLLKEDQRTKGFGIIRVAFNVSAAIGPAIGGLLAARSYLAIFILDAVISSIAAVLVYLTIPETKPEPKPGVQQETFTQSFRGYSQVFRNIAFIFFALASTLAWIVFLNFNSTLGVFLRDVHAIPESGYGALISINATIVIIMQFWVTNKVEKYPSMLMMAAGTLIFSFGYFMFGIFNNYSWFIIAMIFVTIGEMITAPISNSEVIKFAPEDMRGRYSAVYRLSWTIPSMIGPYLAGLILDSNNPNWLWYACGIVGTMAAIGFIAIHYTRTRAGVKAPTVEQPVV
jgi:MFS family permease